MAVTFDPELRRQQVNEAEHSGRMEGLEISESARQAGEAYIRGELDADELVARVKSGYGHD